ncbi:MAG TPA: hemolysin family protein [Candidatus Corynebacterium avicola]|uniref:Hemolysin family protein n=1 Tax=Candidatus Corynebacterium avicola TaxID=2838527 RepID=A0A9D1RTV6_9CORY|nr:hemolysin family protein [Candidatus Corynebacterium avicola]
MPDLPVIVSAVIALLVVLPLAGVFSSMETALSSLSLARVESLVKDERSGASRLLRVMNDRPSYINLLVLLRTVCEASAAVLVTVVALDIIGDRGWGMAVAIVLVSLLIYVAVGVVSRTMGRRNPYTLSMRGSMFLVAVTKVLGPLAKVLVWFGGLFTPGRALRDGPFASEIELREMVDIASERGVVEVDERRMIQSVFDLASTTAREVMVPRPEILWIEDDKTAGQAVRLCVRSGLSRVPVVGESVDDVVGMVYLKDLVDATYDSGSRSTPVAELMREPVFVPDSRMLDDLLEDMQRDQIHIAVLVDEYGGTAGIVSIEDIIEEIVGEISDEYDGEDDAPVEYLEPGRYRVDSWLSLGDLMEVYEETGVDLEFPEEITDEVETVAGLVSFELGRVPLPGAEVDVAGLHLTCEGGRDRRGRVKLRSVVVTGPTPGPDGEDTASEDGDDHDNIEYEDKDPR